MRARKRWRSTHESAARRNVGGRRLARALRSVFRPARARPGGPAARHPSARQGLGNRFSQRPGAQSRAGAGGRERAAGRRYFVHLEAVHGITVVQAEMRLVSDAEGRSLLAQSRWAGAAPAAPAAARGASQPSATQPVGVVPQARAPAEPDRGSEIALIAKGGRFKLAEPQQLLGVFPSTFEAASKPVYGLELEWRGSSGFAAGGELFYYRNKLSLDGTPLTGQQEVGAFLVNAKYYLRAASWLYPYFGVGAGYAAGRLTGDITGKAAGPAYQGVAGIELRFGHVGLNVQYKSFSSTVEDASGAKVKVGGKGAIGGLSIIF